MIAGGAMKTFIGVIAFIDADEEMFNKIIKKFRFNI